MPRRRLVLILMGAFTVGNALSVLAGTYGLLMVARFIAGSAARRLLRRRRADRRVDG
jgi:predicted MFS family arabinose efflux permease